jgi:hypothetical protein
VYHCTARCARQAFAFGKDPQTGEDFSHRRKWITTREEQLAQLFAIEIESHSELSNHLHLMLRTRPDVAQRWSDKEVARRWCTATRLAKRMDGTMPDPHPKKVQELLADKEKLAEARRRLSKVSWFMGILCENIARRGNDEEGKTGAFWEGRFHCRKCLSLNAMLLCSIYVDLNPKRAGEVDVAEHARHTSVFNRMRAATQPPDAADRADGWLGELTLEPERLADRDALAYSSRTGRRASDLGFLPISLADYVALLRWTAAEIDRGARTTIPQNLVAILERLEVKPEAWVETVERFEELFGHAVGPAAAMAAEAERMGQGTIKGMAASQRVFA